LAKIGPVHFEIIDLTEIAKNTKQQQNTRRPAAPAAAQLPGGLDTLMYYFYHKIHTIDISLCVTSYRPGGGETICPTSMAVRLAADLRPSADGFAVRIHGHQRPQDFH